MILVKHNMCQIVRFLEQFSHLCAIVYVHLLSSCDSIVTGESRFRWERVLELGVVRKVLGACFYDFSAFTSLCDGPVRFPDPA